MKRRRARGEIVVGVEGVVAEIFPGASVESVGTALGNDDDLAGTSESIFCAVTIFEDRKFRDAIDDWQDVDVGEVTGVHVVDSVDGVGGVFDGVAVDDQGCAALEAARAQGVGAMGAADSRDCDGQRLEVSSIQHQVVDLSAGNRASALGALRIDLFGVRRDRDLGIGASDLEDDIIGPTLAGVDLNAVGNTFLEAGLTYLNAVESNGEAFSRIESAFVGGLERGDTSSLICDLHLGLRDARTGRVGHNTRD